MESGDLQILKYEQARDNFTYHFMKLWTDGYVQIDNHKIREAFVNLLQAYGFSGGINDETIFVKTDQ